MLGECQAWQQEQDTATVRLVTPEPGRADCKSGKPVGSASSEGLPPARPSWPVRTGVGRDT